MTRELISPEKRSYHKEYNIVFRFVEDPNSGYSFPCNAQGTVSLETLPPSAVNNYIACCLGDVNGHQVTLVGISEETIAVVENAVIRCDCGQPLELVDWYASECVHCGREYNGGGQLLGRYPVKILEQE